MIIITSAFYGTYLLTKSIGDLVCYRYSLSRIWRNGNSLSSFQSNEYKTTIAHIAIFKAAIFGGLFFFDSKNIISTLYD